MDLGIKGRTAIVGGSSRGMAKAAAITLAKEGASVVICSRTEADIRKAEKEIASASSSKQVLALAADLTRPDVIKHVVGQTLDRFGHIDILVNNVGGPPPGQPSQLTDEQWYAAIEQNFLSAVRMTREVLPHMKQRKWGRVINLLSNAVRQPVLDLVLSTSSRLAVVGYAKMLSNEVSQFGITVNNVLPGQVLTDRMTSLYGKMGKEQGRELQVMLDEAAQRIPMRRLGRPDEMGDLIAFLASERASYITGQSISLDGGALQAVI